MGAEGKDLNLAREDDDSGASGYVRAPAALLALEDQGGGGGDGDAGFYRLAQCHVHSSGALFLDAMVSAVHLGRNCACGVIEKERKG
eukprot:1159634-Pelagomonas_calceolata.AAC.4